MDYAPPRDAFERAVARLVRLYEGGRYVDFVRSDIRGLLGGAGVGVQAERRFLRDTVRAVVGACT